MNTNYTATLIKSGNSYALRIPKWVVEASGLKLGDKVHAGTLTRSQNNANDNSDHNKATLLEALQALAATGKSGEGLAAIKDPVAWQREIRKDRPLPGRE